MAEVKLNGAKTLATMAEAFCNGDDRTEFILVADANNNQAQVITHCSKEFMFNAMQGLWQAACAAMKADGADKDTMMTMYAMIGAKAMASVLGEENEEDDE